MTEENKPKRRRWATGVQEPLREDLVAWPAATPEPVSAVEVRATPKADVAPEIDLHEELARAKREVRRLQARVDILVEENERLRRAGGGGPPLPR